MSAFALSSSSAAGFFTALAIALGGVGEHLSSKAPAAPVKAATDSQANHAGCTHGGGQTAAKLSGESARGSEPLGYGQCSVAYCHCRGYMGQDWNCSNCGHRYQDHY